MKELVPDSLRVWFRIDSAISFVIGISLILMPRIVMEDIGWNFVEPFMSRIAGSFLIGIGGASLLCESLGIEGYISMLNFKIIWSAAAIVAVLISLKQGSPKIGLLIAGVMLLFLILWGYYIRMVSKQRGMH